VPQGEDVMRAAMESLDYKVGQNTGVTMHTVLSRGVTIVDTSDLSRLL